MVAIKHKSVTGRPVNIGDWNQEHVLTGTPGKTFMFGEDGVAVEVDPSEGVDLTDYYTKAEIDALLESAPPGDTTAPTFTSSNPSGSYAEGAGVGGTLTANETVTFGKTGTDANRVTLNTTTGVWSLEPTDYETKTSYSWQFTATDAATNVSTQSVSITVTDVVETPTFPTTVNTALPVFSITPETTTNPTTFTLLDLEGVIAGDTMWIEAATDDGFTANVTRHYHAVTNAELNAGEPFNFTFTPALSTLTSGTRRYRPTLQRGSERSAYGTAQRVGPNDVAPALSALSVSDVTFTTANVNVTTNYGAGTLYTLLTTTNVAPTTAAIVAGLSQAVTSAGAKVQAVTGTSGTDRYAWVMHRPDAGPDSAITEAGLIEFADPVVSSAWDPVSINYPGHPAHTVNNDNRTITQTSASGPIKFQGAQTRTSGKLWIEYELLANGADVNPGLLDSTTGVIMTFNANSDDAGPGGPWGLTYSNVAVVKVRFEVDFDNDTVQAFANGVSAGTHSFPASFGTSLRGWTEIGGAVGAYITINTGQATPTGTVTPGFSAWG